MSGRLYSTYVVLILASVLLIGHIQAQQALTVLWLVSACWMWFAAQRKGISLRESVVSTTLFLLPGVTLVLTSIASVSVDSSGQWANGLLEFWFHPFVLLLELFPAKRIGIYSEVYLATCIVPLGMILCSALCWSAARVLSTFVELRRLP